ncbi:DUF177 domain-containing protein [Maridesulfovibrio bastinii]|uniref:DUF177 domain-containing protein n=1 Tax=Maridesulfovibrio bastinii TaxID=47157 RepID=UPI000428FCE3|nr:DUF177 domain-containing protein [Maridesulfovibrio bastinii]
MKEIWLDLNDIPEEGKNFIFDDQSFWEEAWKNFKFNTSVGEPLVSEIFVLPQENGCLYKGSLSGSVIVPCDRCMADHEQPISSQFEDFEQLAEEGEESFLEAADGTRRLNAGAIFWEQFVLAYPSKPLCSEDCKGLCPECGADLNKGKCECKQDKGDPRLAVLRNLKIKN